EFLNNLARRAMNSERGVEPRLPSLFAPAAAAAIWPPMGETSGSDPLEAAVDRETDVAAPMKSLRPTQLSRLEEEEQPQESPSPALIRHRSSLSVLQDAQPDSPSSVENNRARDESRVEDPVRRRPLISAKAAPAPNPPRLADRRDLRGEDRVAGQTVD